MPEQGLFETIEDSFDKSEKKSFGISYMHILSRLAGFEPDDTSISNQESMELIASIVIPYVELMNGEYAHEFERSKAKNEYIMSQVTILQLNPKYSETNPHALKRRTTQALNFFRRKGLYLPENYQQFLGSVNKA